MRIVFLNVNTSRAIQIMCEVRTWQWNNRVFYLSLQASRAGHLFPHYIWIAYAGDYQGLAMDTTCDSDELVQFLEGAFTLLPTLSNETVSNAMLYIIKLLLVHMQVIIGGPGKYEQT